MDGEYSTAGQGRTGLALQGNVGQGRAGFVSGMQDLHALQFHRRGGRQSEILKFHVLPLIQSVYLLCVMAPKE